MITGGGIPVGLSGFWRYEQDQLVLHHTCAQWEAGVMAGGERQIIRLLNTPKIPMYISLRVTLPLTSPSSVLTPPTSVLRPRANQGHWGQVGRRWWPLDIDKDWK